jgi:hypothetical protein
MKPFFYTFFGDDILNMFAVSILWGRSVDALCGSALGSIWLLLVELISSVRFVWAVRTRLRFLKHCS